MHAKVCYHLHFITYSRKLQPQVILFCCMCVAQYAICTEAYFHTRKGSSAVFKFDGVPWPCEPFLSLQTPQVSFWHLFDGPAVWEGHRTYCLNSLCSREMHRLANSVLIDSYSPPVSCDPPTSISNTLRKTACARHSPTFLWCCFWISSCLYSFSGTMRPLRVIWWRQYRHFTVSVVEGTSQYSHS